MIKFLIKGILRDKSRSLLPIIIIAIGVMLTVMLSGYMSGAFGDLIDQNAKFETGHVKVMTRAYAENKDQIPNDLALLDIGELISSLEQDFPDMDWAPRIKFGGLIDVPDETGETKAQGPAIGMALDLLSKNSTELSRMNIESSMVSGHVPTQSSEAIIGHEFAEKLGMSIGDNFTYFGTTMEGSMTFKSFQIAGTVRFGTTAMDNRILIVDVSDAQLMLDMENGAGELLGFSKMGVYDHHEAAELANNFNKKYKDDKDEFAPIMLTLKDQNNLASIIDYANSMTSIFVFIFIIAMSLVLWNTGLLGGLRRYKEFGIRLALGEPKGRIYGTLILEAIIVGIIGSILGTAIGLAITYYLQIVGIDVSGQISNSSMIMPTVLRSKITLQLFFIGFIPGVLAMVLGTMLAGIGIYKRETANLFKELEV
jgi:putative ABC transport system permease protein